MRRRGAGLVVDLKYLGIIAGLGRLNEQALAARRPAGRPVDLDEQRCVAEDAGTTDEGASLIALSYLIAYR